MLLTDPPMNLSDVLPTTSALWNPVVPAPEKSSVTALPPAITKAWPVPVLIFSLISPFTSVVVPSSV